MLLSAFSNDFSLFCTGERFPVIRLWSGVASGYGERGKPVGIMYKGIMVLGNLRSFLKPSPSKVWAQHVPMPEFTAAR
jgi:hypothetical protein